MTAYSNCCEFPEGSCLQLNVATTHHHHPLNHQLRDVHSVEVVVKVHLAQVDALQGGR
jgi:hypothetical protein